MCQINEEYNTDDNNNLLFDHRIKEFLLLFCGSILKYNSVSIIIWSRTKSYLLYITCKVYSSYKTDEETASRSFLKIIIT